MEQQLDLFTQRRFELMIEMSTKKLATEVLAIKESLCSQAGEISSLKSQINRLQFSPPQNHAAHAASSNKGETEPTLAQIHTADQVQQKKEVHIVDCRPDGERHEEFVSGAARNAEPVRPRYGDYNPGDVSIDKFFYFGRK